MPSIKVKYITDPKVCHLAPSHLLRMTIFVRKPEGKWKMRNCCDELYFITVMFLNICHVLNYLFGVNFSFQLDANIRQFKAEAASKRQKPASGWADQTIVFNGTIQNQVDEKFSDY